MKGKTSINGLWVILVLLLIQPLLLDGQVDKRKNTNKSQNNTSNETRATASNTVLTWVSPNTDETGSVFSSAKEIQDIKIKAISDRKLAVKDIKVYINNKALDSSKFDEGSLTPPKKTNKNQFSHTFAGSLRLKEGENIVEIHIREGGEIIKETLTIKYYPKRINLHVLAIGPYHSNLEFTSKDAEDFAAAFKDQEGLLFKEVFVDKLVGAEETEQNDIKKQLKDLKFRYEQNMENKINDNDLLLIYISSHGKKVDDRFKILTSGYKAGYEEFTSIDFEADIINFLNDINCKKLIFIDACNSGSAEMANGSKDIKDDDMAKALNTLLETSPGLSTFTSCQSHELSYEDKKWGNGAFTEAILAAFKNKPYDGLFPDADRNSILELGELKTYIQKYVPALVKQAKPEAGTQIPLVTINELGSDFPIYALKGYHPPSVLPLLDLNERWINDPNPSVNTKVVNFYDKDGDYIADEIDKCPSVHGPLSNSGCPEAKAVLTGPMNGQLRDSRDGKTYSWVQLIDGKRWMKQNLNFKSKDSYCFDDKGKNCDASGRLYTWNAAQKACPEGWRLPTEYDWTNLVNLYGGAKEAYKALLEGGDSPFSIQLSGLRRSNKDFCCTGEFGNYWTNDHSISNGIYMDFNSLFGSVQQDKYDKNTALSCRCVQD